MDVFLLKLCVLDPLHPKLYKKNAIYLALDLALLTHLASIHSIATEVRHALIYIFQFRC